MRGLGHLLSEPRDGRAPCSPPEAPLTWSRVFRYRCSACWVSSRTRSWPSLQGTTMPVLPKHTVTFILALGSRAGLGRTGAWPPGTAPLSGDVRRTRRCPARGDLRLLPCSPTGGRGREPGRGDAGTRRVGRAQAETPRAKVKLRVRPGPARPCLWRWPWRPWQGRPQAPGWSGRRRRRARGQSWEETFAPAPNSSDARGALGSLGPRASLGPALKGAAALAGHRAHRGVAPSPGLPRLTRPWVACCPQLVLSLPHTDKELWEL